MGTLLKPLIRFLTRDVIFIIGGLVVIIAGLYTIDLFTIREVPWPYVFFGAGLAYTVGYAIQDLFCLAGVVTTANYFEAGPIARTVYRLYQKTQWVQPTRFSVDKVRTKVDLASAEIHYRLERLITLKLVGTTMGPCLCVATLMILSHALRTWSAVDFKLAAFSGVLALTLMALAWVKACEQMRYMSFLDSVLPDPSAAQMLIAQQNAEHPTFGQGAAPNGRSATPVGKSRVRGRRNRRAESFGE